MSVLNISSRRDSGEDRDSQSRHEHKKTKRNKKNKKTNKMFSADQERKLKSEFNEQNCPVASHWMLHQKTWV